MSLLDALKAFLTPPPPGKGIELWLYVKCKRCGSPLAVRVNLMNEPSIDYETNEYRLTKEMMDSKCFTLMRADLRLDAKRHIVEQKIDKGEFITREQYDALINAQ